VSESAAVSTCEPAPAVLTRREGRTLVVTINRPEVRNAVNAAVTLGIGEALELAEADADIRAVIITGAGDKSFCAGADLKASARGERPASSVDARAAAWGFAGYVKHHIGKPLIAAVNGFALGGGTEIALASDLVVAADTASFGLPEVKRGILAGAGGTFRLAMQIPPKVAMELLLTGDPITAQRALDLGLVNKVVPHDEVMSAALELSERICRNAPLSVQASKRIARGISGGRISGEDQYWSLILAEADRVMSSADAKEGRLAFAEKRDPVWTGR
jgi:crotonobetainyl-CoA hydratase